MSILSSQADPPTLKNLDFASAGARFSKNQGIRYKDAFDGVLGLSWARFGCSWGLLGGSFPAFWDSRRLLEFSKLLFLAPLSPHLGSLQQSSDSSAALADSSAALADAENLAFAAVLAGFLVWLPSRSWVAPRRKFKIWPAFPLVL